MKVSIKTPTIWLKSLFRFFREIKVEIKKVDWPRSNDTMRYGMVVILGSVVFAVFLGGVDTLFSFILNNVILG